MSQDPKAVNEALDKLNATIKKNAAMDVGGSVNSDMLNKAMDSAKSALGDVGSLADTLKNSVNDMLSSATGALTSSLSQLSASFPSAVNQFFPDINKLTGQLGSIVPAGILGRKEVDEKIKSLMPDSADAISNPLSFITKNLSDTIQGMNISGKGLPSIDLLSGLGSDALSNLTKSVGFDIGSSGDMLKAITQVTGNLSSGIAGSIGTLTNGITTGIDTVVSGVTSGVGDLLGGLTSAGGTLINGLTSGLNDTLKTFTGALTDNPIATAAKDLVGGIYDALPEGMQSLVRSASQSAINGVVGDLMGDKVLGVTNLMSQLNGYSNLGGAINTYLGMEDSYSYPRYTVNGAPSSSFGNANSKDISTLFKAASSICAGIESPKFANYRDSKDLFDVLLALAASSGLVGLLSQLSQCIGADSDTFFDSRSSKILRNQSSSAAYSGNAPLYQTIQSIVGPAQMKNSRKDVISLTTNMKGTPENINAYNAIMNSYGYAPEDLVYDQYKGMSVINAPRTALMSSTNTAITDQVLGAGVRTLVQSAVSAFS